MLAHKGTLLVLRAYHRANRCHEYWALIPPAAATQSGKRPVSGDAESQLFSGLNQSENETSQFGTSSYHLKAENRSSQTEHMILLKLVDRDELLEDFLSVTAAKRASGGRRSHAVVAEGVASFTNTVSSQESDCDEEAAEEERAAMEDTQEYLGRSLFDTMGAPVRYNPLLSLWENQQSGERFQLFS